MAIDVFSETVLTLSEATKRLPRLKQGKKIHVSSLYRWMLGGCRSVDGMVVRLETVKVGGRTCTSLEALQRFCDRLSGDTTVVTPPTSTRRQRLRQIEAAEQELKERWGI